MKYLAITAALALAVGCQGNSDTSGQSEVAESDSVAVTQAAEELVTSEPEAQSDVVEDGYPSGESLNGLKEILPSDFEPTFTRDTVIKLNGIVQRSLDTINAYDELRRSVRADPSLDGAGETTAALEEMDEIAKAALIDITAEVDRLEASDETYNPVVLAGMVTFVTKVEDEVGETLENGFGF